MELVIVVAIILVFLGIVGSFVPVLPGPLFSFIAILAVFLFKNPSPVSLSHLLWFGFFMVILTIMDYLAPIIGAKFFGASRKGIFGSVFGALMGIFFFPPLGIFLGAFLGAIFGEYYAGKKGSELLKAGIGVLVGSFFVILAQIAFSIAVAVYFIKILF